VKRVTISVFGGDMEDLLPVINALVDGLGCSIGYEAPAYKKANDLLRELERARQEKSSNKSGKIGEAGSDPASEA